MIGCAKKGKGRQFCNVGPNVNHLPPVAYIASQYLVLAAKARAVLFGRYYVSTDDIRAVAGPVLRHRIITNFNAEAEGLKPDDIVKRLIKATPVDEHEAEQSGKLPKIFKSANAS